jgi:hypothetical protein
MTKVTVEENNEDVDAMYEAEDASPLQLNPSSIDPDMKYRFVFNNPNRLSRMKMKGYDFVTIGEGVELREAVAGQTNGDGHILVGDLVLMRCPKKRYDRRRRDVQTLTNERMGDGAAAAKAIADIKQIAEETGLPSRVITSPGGTTV